MKRAVQEELTISVKWLEFLKWLLPTTEKFPKRLRFTFADRINNIALDIVEDLLEGQYTSKSNNRQKQAILRRMNLRLEKLRVLLRICCEQHYLSNPAYDYAMRAINEVGCMLGGWMKQQEVSKVGSV